MFEALVVTLREGMEGALVLAIALAFLERQGRSGLKGALIAGTLAAVAGSAVLTFFLTRLTYNEELAEGIAMLVGAALVVSLVVWMWRAAPRMRQEIEAGMTKATTGQSGALGVFLFAFAMVLREGVETAVFLSAASFSSEGLALWLGAAIGLALAVVFGALFVRGSVKLPLKPFFSLTAAVLLLIAVQLVVGGLHELSEAEVLPSSQREMALIGPVVKNEMLLFTLTVAFAALWLLRPTSLPRVDAAAGPEARMARAAAARDASRRRWTGLIGLVVVGFLATAFVQGSRMPERPPATPVAFQGGVIRIDPAPLADGRLHFYEATLPEAPVRFFAVKSGDQILICFDACEICGAKGYFEDGHAVVCRNCASPISRATLGRSGGCNPIPLPHGTEGGLMTIAEHDVRAILPHLQGR
ncbi:MAG TPA: Fe-S-containing protein [Candidatus Eisenbacteria bacterium]|nr:Fe-S-containing protein [Candidatus Eisenbacteria bacterium]